MFKNPMAGTQECHPREGGDPVGIFSFSGQLTIDGKNSNWVPAFAGMTCIVIACLVSGVVFAADEKSSVISYADCAAVVAYQPSADVEYKPGVDVDGNPVTPADLSPSVVETPKKLSFDLNVDAARQLGMLVPPGTQGLMNVGKVTVDTVSGEVTWNGKPVEGDALARLQAACVAQKAPDSPQKPSK